jgi:hypothetical protein
MIQNLRTSKLTFLLLLTICLTENSGYCRDNQLVKADTVMTEELMSRLILYTLASKKESMIEADHCAIFSMCSGTIDLPAKRISTRDLNGIKHYFVVSLAKDSSDIIIQFFNNNILYSYLSDKSGNLRAAAICNENGCRLIMNELATEKFKIEMQFWAKTSAELPPTGIAEKSN